MTLSKSPTSRETIYNIVANLTPFDALEEQHISETLAWIQSDAPIFRIQKPDIPNKHLVSYFVLFDAKTSQILLVDHKKAQLWLPSGGHVEIDEDPKETVKRECVEELSLKADFWQEAPLFLTSTLTVGLTAGHIDVSLWYILKGNPNCSYTFDREEFNAIKWFSFEKIPFGQSDPHMHRFIAKLKKAL